MWTIWVCSSLLFGYVPCADHPSEKLYSLTRVCTLISVILNMLALDFTVRSTVKCVSYPPVHPTLRLTDNTSIKLWVIFLAVSYFFLIKIHD